MPTYVVVEREEGKSKGRRTAKDILAELKKEASKANRVYLATDPDREGEAIAWHIDEALGLDDETTFRIAFNEITRTAVQQAIANPGKINMDRVQAQEARRILDRVVGYPLSDLLGKKVARGSSRRPRPVRGAAAGRRSRTRDRGVQDRGVLEDHRAACARTGTVSLPRLAPSRSSMRKADAEEPASEADEATAEAKPRREGQGRKLPEGTYLAELAEWDGKKFESATNETDASGAWRPQLDTATLRRVEARAEGPRREGAAAVHHQHAAAAGAACGCTSPPSGRCRWPSGSTRACDLGAEGTGRPHHLHANRQHARLRRGARRPCAAHIQASLRRRTTCPTSRTASRRARAPRRPTRRSARPTCRTPRSASAALGLHGDQLRLYTLIYNRFVASQMTPAIFAVTNVEVTATPTEGDATRPVPAPGQAC